jgi:hypothetical protein
MFVCNLYDRGKAGGPGGFITKLSPQGSEIFCESELLNQPIGIVCFEDKVYVSNSSDGKVIKTALATGYLR